MEDFVEKRRFDLLYCGRIATARIVYETVDAAVMLQQLPLNSEFVERLDADSPVERRKFEWDQSDPEGQSGENLIFRP
jgi:hypothetical protein